MYRSRPSPAYRTRSAFTLVELLVTIAIIGVLTGLLIGGLRGAIGSARKTKEMNGLRGIHAAWYQYSSTYEEQVLPGFLDEVTQERWQVTTTNLSGAELPRSLSQTYPWRLASFVDNPYSTFVGYMEAEGADTSANGALAAPWDGAPELPAWAQSLPALPGSLVALQPGFAYNAYYVGGWYEQGGPPRFTSAAWTTAQGANRTGGLVATRLAGITRTTQTVIFSAATFRGVGDYRIRGSNEDLVPGCAWIVPPQLGAAAVWQPFGMTDAGILQVLAPQGVPARRHNGQVAVVHADGSTENASIATLLDMRLWIDVADRVDFSHADN